MAKAALAVDNTSIERFTDVKAAEQEFNRDMNRAKAQFQAAVRTINIDNAGPLYSSVRRKLYQEPIKAYKEAAMTAFERFRAGMAS
jgi:hypothetical protein